MLTDLERKEILQLLHEQVVPAIGCTEPMAVALCVAKATEQLGERPEHISLRLSANILKNAMGVGIPGTGMVGLPIAVALGALIGKSAYGLEVLRDCTPEAVAQGQEYISEGRIHIELETADPDKLFIHARVSAGIRDAEACIKGSHTHFVECRDESVKIKDESVARQDEATTAARQDMLTLRKVYEFATTTPLSELEFILEAKRLNSAAAAAGLKENYGHKLGKTMCSPLGRGIMGDSIFSKILSITSCACDARMAGALIPVMSNSGSGNQGICATMPVVVFAEENHNTEDELIRALVISNLTAIYMKQSLGALSAL